MRGFRKEGNMRADPRVTLLAAEASRWVEVRGLAELAEDGALEHLDGLARRYMGAQRYFGEVVPAELAEREVPVLARIHPIRVVTEVLADASTERTDRLPSLSTAVLTGDEPDLAIPPSHRGLLGRPLTAALGTRMPEGHPQIQPVWFELAGDLVLVNTTRERQKGRNLQADPRATILVVDPDDESRWIEIRGDVEITEDGALDHLDRLMRAYTDKPAYYGWIYPPERRERETRIVCRLHPRHIVCDAIHR